MITTLYPRAVSNLTKQQCKQEIARLERLISDFYMQPEISISYLEQRIWWQERLGELVANDPIPFPGRKFRR